MTLRKNEEMVIFTKQQAIYGSEIKQAVAFLQSEFEAERLDWMDDSLPFDAEAALWSAKIVYYTAQLLLVREGSAKDLPALFPAFSGAVKVSAQLTADLLLRFLPALIKQLKLIDTGDPLIVILEEILKTFHYSAIGYDIEIPSENITAQFANPVFKKLYLERIVARQDYKRAEIPYINKELTALFGLHKSKIWNTLNIINQEQ